MVEFVHYSIVHCASQPPPPIPCQHWLSLHVVCRPHLKVLRRPRRILQHLWPASVNKPMFSNRKKKISCPDTSRSNCREIGAKSSIWKNRWKNWNECQFVRKYSRWRFQGISFLSSSFSYAKQCRKGLSPSVVGCRRHEVGIIENPWFQCESSLWCAS